MSVTWIPSEAIEGFAKLPFEAGLTHYDKPPPDVLDDLDNWRRNDRFREANELRAFIEVKDGRIVEFGQLGRGYLGSTTARLGPAHVTFPGVGLPDLRPTPVVEPTSVRFVQTVGGRMGVPMPRPVPRKPYFQIWSAIAWTTLGLTINADGSSDYELVGASPFPRHWIYDHSGKLAAKSGTIDFKTWFNDSFGEHTPWGDHDSPALATAAETALERRLSQTIMGAGKKPEIRVLNPGDTLVEQGQAGQELFLLLDGVLSVIVDGQEISEIGPGGILGERAILEGGMRTSTLRAVTRSRVAVTSAAQLDEAVLAELAASHRKEERTS